VSKKNFLAILFLRSLAPGFKEMGFLCEDGSCRDDENKARRFPDFKAAAKAAESQSLPEGACGFMICEVVIV
jgi:hypothetical protein